MDKAAVIVANFNVFVFIFFVGSICFVFDGNGRLLKRHTPKC